MLKMYIAIIGEHIHNDFHPSYWNASPFRTAPYRIRVETLEEAKDRALEYCKSFTENINTYNQMTLKGYTKNDEVMFKVIDVYGVDDLDEIT